MGTRNLTMVWYENQWKVAQYCQWDGYPDGQGKTVLDFLKNVDIETFKQQVNKCKFLTQKEINEKQSKAVPSVKGKEYISGDESKQLKNALPELHRDTGAKILSMIMNSNGLGLFNDYKFAGDGLFCEWAYVIDLDKNILEVYTGFHKDNNEGRFADLKNESEYIPIQLAKSFPLDNLPEFEEFTKELKQDEDE